MLEGYFSTSLNRPNEASHHNYKLSGTSAQIQAAWLWDRSRSSFRNKLFSEDLRRQMKRVELRIPPSLKL